MRYVQAIILLACGLSACSSAADGGSAGSPAMTGAAGTSADDLADEDDDFEGCPPENPALALGERATGSQYALKLMAAAPDQPERYTDNDWTVQLTTLDGSSAPDAQIVRGQTFMPIHGHDGRVDPNVMELGTAGEFQVARLNFSMRGPWEVRLWLHSDSIDEDYLVFPVCVAK